MQLGSADSSHGRAAADAHTRALDSSRPSLIVVPPIPSSGVHVGIERDGSQLLVAVLSTFDLARGPAAMRHYTCRLQWGRDGSFAAGRVRLLCVGAPASTNATIAEAEARLLTEARHARGGPISVEPAHVTVDGLRFGLVVHEPDPDAGADGFWSVTLEPGSVVAFHAPWDGTHVD